VDEKLIKFWGGRSGWLNLRIGLQNLKKNMAIPIAELKETYKEYKRLNVD
jgi:hypothetical protein